MFLKGTPAPRTYRIVRDFTNTFILLKIEVQLYRNPFKATST